VFNSESQQKNPPIAVIADTRKLKSEGEGTREEHIFLFENLGALTRFLNECTKMIPKIREQLQCQANQSDRNVVKAEEDWQMMQLGRKDLKKLKAHNSWLFAVVVTKKDLEYLRPREFLNDNVVDFYLNHVYSSMVQERYRTQMYLFNSFFYTRLTQECDTNVQDVEKWAPADVNTKQFIVIPINKNLHWTVVVVLVSKCKIIYLDSLEGPGNRVCKPIKRYLTHIKCPGNWNGEDVVVNAKVPTQPNHYDCGIFVLEYIERIAQADDMEKCLGQVIRAKKAKWFEADEVVGTKRRAIKRLLLEKVVD